jgi:signal transduction histidine kinase/CheY-like chemotaxis protein
MGRESSPLRRHVEASTVQSELETARPVLKLVAAFLALGCVTDGLDPSLSARGTLLAVDVASLAVALLSAVRVRRRDCPPAQARTWLVLMGAVALTNVLVTIGLTHRVYFSANLSILVLGLGTTLLAPLTMALVAGIASGAWLAVVAQHVGVNELGAWFLTIGGSAFLSVALSTSRRRVVRRLAVLAFRDARRRERLERAAAELRDELERRRKLESAQHDLRAQLLQAQKMEAIGTLAGGVAHDMNNVLAAITSLAEGVAAELPPGGTPHADLQSLLDAAQRGAELTRNLLAFGRKGKNRNERVSMRKVAAAVSTLLSRTLPKRVTLLFESDERDDTVQGDPSQLQHALVNLCINASDAMERGGVIRVRTSAQRLEGARAERFAVAAGEYVIVEVRDDGCGMDAETMRRACEPFFTTKETGKGTGLGLAMVYGTAVGHGGGVTIESAPGAGTTVRVAIPRVDAVPDARISTPMPITAPARSRVLLVDDEPLVRRGARRLLERIGYEVVEAENGVRALVVFRAQGPFDAVILDMSMPEMGGTECFHRLRELDPHARVLLASGYASDGEADALLARGARGFLEKPYNAASLGAALARCVGRALAPTG